MFEDVSPGQEWDQSVDGETSWIAGNPTTGLQWNWAVATGAVRPWPYRSRRACEASCVHRDLRFGA